MNRCANEEIVYNPNLENIKKDCYLEMEFLKKIQPSVAQILNAPIPEDELGFWAMFLKQKSLPQTKTARVGLIVATHGTNTASSMATLANELIHEYCAYSLDVPAYQTKEDMFLDLQQLMRKVDNGRGILLLADMGTLANCEDRLMSATGIECKIIPNVSSTLVLEAVKTIVSTNEPLEAVYSRIYYDYYQAISTSFKRHFFNEKPGIIEESLVENSRAIIITLCSTGYGGATKIKEILEQAFADYPGLQIVAMSVRDDINSFVQHLAKGKLKLIIGSFSLDIPGVSQMGVDTVFHKEGLIKIRKLLDSSPDHIPDEEPVFFEEEEIFKLLTKECRN